TGGALQEFSLSGGELADGTASGSEGRVPIVPPSRFIVTNLTAASRAVMLFYNKRGTAEQWIKQGSRRSKWSGLTCGALEGLALFFFAKAAEVIATPWELAAASDFAFQKKTGDRPADMEESARYFAALDSLVGEDIQVHRLVSDVFNLAKPPSVLYEEPLRSRVVARQGEA